METEPKKQELHAEQTTDRQTLMDIRRERLTETSRRDHELVNRAVAFAMERHQYQCRKGSDTPYLLHPLEAMQIVRNMGGEATLMAAAVLHDVLEDTDTTSEELLAAFGQEVTDLVLLCTEDKTKTWEERKRHTIETMQISDKRAKMVTLADKLSNLRTIQRDYELVGEEIWNRFKGTPEQQSWYYGGLAEALGELQDDTRCVKSYWEFLTLFKDIFVSFYYTPEPEALYQVTRDGEGYVLYRHDPQWQPVDSLPEYADKVLRWQAEMSEDMWTVEYWDAVNESLHDLGDDPHGGMRS